MGKFYIVSSTHWEEAYPTDKGYLETDKKEDVLDAVESALEDDATHINISVEFNSEGYGNPYED